MNQGMWAALGSWKGKKIAFCLESPENKKSPTDTLILAHEMYFRLLNSRPVKLKLHFILSLYICVNLLQQQ